MIPFGGGTSISGSLEAPRDETRTVISVDLARMDRRARDRRHLAARARAGRRLRPAAWRSSSTRAARRSATTPTPSRTRRWAAGSPRAPRACSPTATATSPTRRAACAWSRPPGCWSRARCRPRRPARACARWCSAARAGSGSSARRRSRSAACPPERTILGYLFPSWAESLAAMRDIAASEAAPSVTRVADANETAFCFATKKGSTLVDKLQSTALKTFLKRRKGYDVERDVPRLHRLRGRRSARQGAAQGGRQDRRQAQRPLHRVEPGRALRPEEVRHALHPRLPARPRRARRRLRDRGAVERLPAVYDAT